MHEINISEDSFSNCYTISSFYNLLSKNSPTKYGTASLVRSDLIPENILLDSNGRAIVFNMINLTMANLYLPFGNDSTCRSSREKYCAETVPQLLLNRLDSGNIGGDLNCITNKIDCTHNPTPKMSPSLAKMINTFDMKDCFRKLYPNSKIYSHYYHTTHLGEGATRIDRSYSWGNLKVVEAKYEPPAFSDHMAYIVSYNLPTSSSRMFSPRARPMFKVRPEVINDRVFQQNLSDSMKDWKELQDLGLDFLTWWELVVKPGIKRLAIHRGKEINRGKRGELNLLLLQQSYLARKLHFGDLRKLSELRCVQIQIETWYKKESEKDLMKYLQMKQLGYIIMSCIRST